MTSVNIVKDTQTGQITFQLLPSDNLLQVLNVLYGNTAQFLEACCKATAFKKAATDLELSVPALDALEDSTVIRLPQNSEVLADVPNDRLQEFFSRALVNVLSSLTFSSTPLSLDDLRVRVAADCDSRIIDSFNPEPVTVIVGAKVYTLREVQVVDSAVCPDPITVAMNRARTVNRAHLSRAQREFSERAERMEQTINTALHQRRQFPVWFDSRSGYNHCISLVSAASSFRLKFDYIGLKLELVSMGSNTRRLRNPVAYPQLVVMYVDVDDSGRYVAGGTYDGLTGRVLKGFHCGEHVCTGNIQLPALSSSQSPELWYTRLRDVFTTANLDSPYTPTYGPLVELNGRMFRNRAFEWHEDLFETDPNAVPTMVRL